MPNHPIVLASGTITPSGDLIEIALIMPDSMPPVIRIAWPLQPTVADPRRFPDSAARIARLFAEASTALARIKAGRRL